jgi:ABC-type uncharacterized transport system substrate-binding protein
LISSQVIANSPIELLIKDKAKRITLREVLEHPWIEKYCSGIREVRMKAGNQSQFKVFSYQQPNSPKILDEIAKRANDDFEG